MDGGYDGRNMSKAALSIRQSTLWRMSSTTLATAEVLLLQSKAQSTSRCVSSTADNSNDYGRDKQDSTALNPEWVHSQLWSSEKKANEKDANDRIETAGCVPEATGEITAEVSRVASLWSLWLLLNQSFRSFRSDFRRGIDMSFIFASIFWSFSLLDTVGNNRHSERPKVEAFVLLVLMCTAPLWLSLVLRLVLPWFVTSVATENSNTDVKNTAQSNDGGSSSGSGKDNSVKSRWSIRKSLVNAGLGVEVESPVNEKGVEEDLEMTSL